MKRIDRSSPWPRSPRWRSRPARSLGGGEAMAISDYSLVRVRRVSGRRRQSMSVAAPRPWNRHRPILFDDIREVEDWTLTGPISTGSASSPA